MGEAGIYDVRAERCHVVLTATSQVAIKLRSEHFENPMNPGGASHRQSPVQRAANSDGSRAECERFQNVGSAANT